jgi:hypothetical protein
MANYLWSISVPRSNSAVGLGVLCVFLAILVAALVVNHGVIKPLILNFAVWLFMLIGVYAALSFVRRMLRPPIALAANEAGLVVFYRKDTGDYVQPGVVVPWRTIVSFEYESYTFQATGTDPLRRHALVAALLPGNALPLDQISVRKTDNKLYVDVWSKKIADKVVHDLRQLSQQYK